MKTFASIFVLAFIAILGTSSVMGYESMLSEQAEESGSGNLRRRLFFWSKGAEYWESLFYRCCSDAPEDTPAKSTSWRTVGWSGETGRNGAEVCLCPKRGTGSFWGKSNWEKWNKACDTSSEGNLGSIPKKAGLPAGTSREPWTE